MCIFRLSEGSPALDDEFQQRIFDYILKFKINISLAKRGLQTLSAK